jgi:hypothetical protein
VIKQASEPLPASAGRAPRDEDPEAELSIDAASGELRERSRLHPQRVRELLQQAPPAPLQIEASASGECCGCCGG